MYYTVANSNGEIIRKFNFNTPEMIDKQHFLDGEFYISGDIDKELKYIDPVTKEPKDKEIISMVFPDSVNTFDSHIISNLPIPCEVIIDDEPYQVDDGDIELSFEYPGYYLVEVRALNMITLKKMIVVS